VYIDKNIFYYISLMEYIRHGSVNPVGYVITFMMMMVRRRRRNMALQ